jgi:hypothetical protein
VTKKFVPAHKGKSVITDKKWAAEIYNSRRMYIMYEMEKWVNKHPAKKLDTSAKKVFSSDYFCSDKLLLQIFI